MSYNSKYTGEQVEELLDQVANGGGGITSETDPIFSASPAAKITDEDIEQWKNNGLKTYVFDAGVFDNENSVNIDKDITQDELNEIVNADFVYVKYEPSYGGTEVFVLLQLKEKGEFSANYHGMFLENVVVEMIVRFDSLSMGCSIYLIQHMPQYINTYSLYLLDDDIYDNNTVDLSELVLYYEVTENTIYGLSIITLNNSYILQKVMQDGLGNDILVGQYDDNSILKLTYNKLEPNNSVINIINRGTYSKPSTGIPKSDLNESVQQSLEKADTALQEHQDISGLATKSELNNKVDKVDGKQLSTEDFTTLLKQKLDDLSNYDDTAIQESVSKLRTDLDTLVSGDTTTAIKTFNEVIAFLDGLEDTEDLASIIASIEQQIAAKGTVTSITAGDGLTGGTITGSGTIGLSPKFSSSQSLTFYPGLSVGSLMIPDTSVTLDYATLTSRYPIMIDCDTFGRIVKLGHATSATHLSGYRVGHATASKSGFMSPSDKTKLDGIDMTKKQDTLVSGTNIKTINGESILGEGNIVIEGGSGSSNDLEYIKLNTEEESFSLLGNKVYHLECGEGKDYSFDLSDLDYGKPTTLILQCSNVGSITFAPASLIWAENKELVIENGKVVEISIMAVTTEVDALHLGSWTSYNFDLTGN